MNDVTAIGPSGHVGATYCCLFVKPVLQPDPLLERTDDPPAVAYSITALITICEPIYHISALRTFLADTPGAHRRDTYKLGDFGTRYCLTCRAMGHLLCNE